MPLKLWEHKDTSVQLGVNWGGVPSGNVDQPVFIWETLIVVPGKMCKWCWLYRSGAVKKVYLIQTFRSYQKKGRSRSGGGICFRENVNSGECSSETKQRPREYVTDKEKLGSRGGGTRKREVPEANRELLREERIIITRNPAKSSNVVKRSQPSQRPGFPLASAYNLWTLGKLPNHLALNYFLCFFQCFHKAWGADSSFRRAIFIICAERLPNSVQRHFSSQASAS